MQYVWNPVNEEEKNRFFSDFLFEIPGLSKINNKLDLLLEFLLYAMHNEQNINDEKTKINYELNSLKGNLKDDDRSFIKNLFLFKLENKCKTCKNNNDYNLILNLNINEIIKNNSKTTDININSILKQKKNINIKCNLCNNHINTDKIKFITHPNILLIYIQEINNPNVKFNISLDLDLKDNISKNNKDKNTKYKLKGFIRENNNKNIISYSESPVDKNWYEYNNGKFPKKLTKFHSDNNYKIPNLLIYEKI